MDKSCVKCGKQYRTKNGKGSVKAKYCSDCKIEVRKEYFKKVDARRFEAAHPLAGGDETYFYGYKAPLTKFEGGFGYKGVVSYSKSSKQMQCHFCGRFFRNVGSHAKFAHGFTAELYKEKVGLAQKTALVGEETRDKLIVAHKNVPSFSQIGKSKKEVKKHMTKMSNKAEKKDRRAHWTLERRNETGNCPEQLIEKIKKLEVKLGRRPTAEDYQREYGSFQSVITVYGKWDTALKVAGMTTYMEEKSLRSDPDFLLGHLQRFYKEHGRTPRTSDMRRGLLPPAQTYWKVFGNLNNARIKAGVPLVIQLSKFRYDEVTFEELQRNKEKYEMH